MEIVILVIVSIILTLVVITLAVGSTNHRKSNHPMTPYIVRRGVFALGDPGVTEDVYMITRMTRRGEEILAVFPVERDLVNIDLLLELKYLQSEGKTLIFK